MSNFFRYKPVGKIFKPSDSTTSLSAEGGGACHMGRAARMPNSIIDTQLCRKIYSNYTHVVARCFFSTGSTGFIDYEMQKELSAAPDWMVKHMKRKRTKCNALECDAASAASQPGSWRTEATNKNLPSGPEVSYGIPFRWSASRLLAADLRSLVCSFGSETRKYHNDSAACDAMLNLSSWKHEDFWDKFAGASFASLLSTQVANNPNFTLPPSLLELHMHMMGEVTLPALSNVLQRADDEDALLWSGPNAPAWVACSQKNKTCYGKISKAVWYDPAQRAPACKKVFTEEIKSGAVKSSAEGLDICNLNGRTNELCQILMSARKKVFEANCIFAGVCAPQMFVYSPGMYSSSNQVCTALMYWFTLCVYLLLARVLGAGLCSGDCFVVLRDVQAGHQAKKRCVQRRGGRVQGLCVHQQHVGR